MRAGRGGYAGDFAGVEEQWYVEEGITIAVKRLVFEGMRWTTARGRRLSY
jgi:hypothetical protein